MATRINESATPNISASHTAARVTPAPSQPFRAVMQAGGSAVMSGAESAVSRLPGGPVLAAAFRSTPHSGVYAPEAMAAGSAGTAEPASTTGAAPGIENVMAHNAEQNLYYLQLQQQVSAESREYSAMSNVLKARHDTVKNAIGNIR
jgi:hypothetical protein